MLRAVLGSEPLCRPLPGLGPGFCLHGKWADLGTRGPSVRTSPLPGSSVCWSHLSIYAGQPLLSVPHDSFGVSTFSVHLPSAVEQMELFVFQSTAKATVSFVFVLSLTVAISSELFVVPLHTFPKKQHLSGGGIHRGVFSSVDLSHMWTCNHVSVCRVFGPCHFVGFLFLQKVDRLGRVRCG